MLQIASRVLVLIALVSGVVVEHRITLETRFRPLQKRVETCTSPGVGEPNGNGPGSTICDPSQTCCYGGNSVFCIPLDATCCTFVNAGGWCPSGRACQEAVSYIPGLASSCIVPITVPTPTYTSVAPYTQPAASTPSPNKSSSSSGLAAGSIAGIAVSVACSVLGLLFGVGFKIWKHRRNERRERERAAAAVAAQ